MSERSEPGPTTAPGVGTVSDELLRLRPDLDEYAGCRIMLPRSYDVDMDQEGVEVLLARGTIRARRGRRTIKASRRVPRARRTGCSDGCLVWGGRTVEFELDALWFGEKFNWRLLLDQSQVETCTRWA